MDNDIMLQIASKLDYRTRQGMLNWTPYNSDTYRLALGDGTVGISYFEEPYTDSYGQLGPNYILQFYNERNEVIGTLSVFGTSDIHYDLLKSIYDMARSNYLKIDSTFRSMIDAL